MVFGSTTVCASNARLIFGAALRVPAVKGRRGSRGRRAYNNHPIWGKIIGPLHRMKVRISEVTSTFWQGSHQPRQGGHQHVQGIVVVLLSRDHRGADPQGVEHSNPTPFSASSVRKAIPGASSPALDAA